MPTIVSPETLQYNSTGTAGAMILLHEACLGHRRIWPNEGKNEVPSRCRQIHVPNLLQVSEQEVVTKTFARVKNVVRAFVDVLMSPKAANRITFETKWHFSTTICCCQSLWPLLLFSQDS